LSSSAPPSADFPLFFEKIRINLLKESFWLDQFAQIGRYCPSFPFLRTKPFLVSNYSDDQHIPDF
jgi:hypothetical protein